MKPIDVPERVLEITGSVAGNPEYAAEVINLMPTIARFFTGMIFAYQRGVDVSTTYARHPVQRARVLLDRVYVGSDLWWKPWGKYPTRPKNNYMNPMFYAQAVTEAKTLCRALGGTHSWLDTEMPRTKSDHAERGFGPPREELYEMPPKRRAAVSKVVEQVAIDPFAGQVDLMYCAHGSHDYAEPFRFLGKQHWSPETYKIREGLHPHPDNRDVWCSWICEHPSDHAGLIKPLRVVEATNLDLDPATKFYGVYVTKRDLGPVVRGLAEAV